MMKRQLPTSTVEEDASQFLRRFLKSVATGDSGLPARPRLPRPARLKVKSCWESASRAGLGAPQASSPRFHPHGAWLAHFHRGSARQGRPSANTYQPPSFSLGFPRVPSSSPGVGR
jgi:hypothetical protein